MSILVIGGDKIEAISGVLYDLGATNITHWVGRKNSLTHKSIPKDVECLVMLTSFLKHNAMTFFKKEAKKRDIPVVFAKRSVSCVYNEYTKIMNCQNCGKCGRK
jgi:hypothetical protein